MHKQPGDPHDLTRVPALAGCGICIISASDHRIAYANPAFTRMTGWSEDELAAKTPDELIHPDDLTAMQEARRSAADGPADEPRRIAYRLRHKQGRWLRMQADCTPYPQSGSDQPLLLETSVELLPQAAPRRQERHALATQGTGVGIWEWDLTTGHMDNDAMSHVLFGIESGEGHHIDAWFERIHPDDRERVREAVQQAIDEHTVYVCRFRVCHRDGCMRFILGRAHLICAADGTPQRLLGVNIDVSEQTDADAEIREREEMLRHIIKHDPNAIAVFDTQMRYMAVSDRFKHDYDIGDDDIIGRCHYEDFPEVPERWRMVHQRTLRGEIIGNDDDSFERPDGSTTYNRWQCRPWYRDDGNIGGIVIYSEVTTERKLAEIALKESEHRLKMALEAAQIGIWDWDLSTGVPTNDAQTHALFDIDPEDGHQQELWFERICEEDRPAVNQALDDALASRKDYDLRYRVRWRDGSIHHLVAKGEVIRNDEGTPVRFLGLSMDISDQVRLQEELGQKSKMAAIGQLAGGVAHDFNNQLTAILGNAELLLKQLDDSRQRGFAESIAAAARHSADLTRQLLDFARKGVMSRAPVRIEELAREVVGILEHSIDKRIAINLQLCAGGAWVLGDGSQLQNAILNLALNARDAMADGGRLRIATEHVHIGADHCLAQELTPGPYVRITIGDTGPGIPPELLKRVREPFFTTKEVGKGTGLGLSAADGVAAQHGGLLHISSQPGEGTEVSIYLPCHRGDDEERPAAEPSPLSRQRGRILIVDDEPLVGKLLEEMLETAGPDAHWEQDPREGIRYYECNSSVVDLVILDVIMPHLDGAGVYERLRLIDTDVPVLLISGHSAVGMVEHLLANGVRTFLQKPFSEREVLQAIDAILAEQAAQAES